MYKKILLTGVNGQVGHALNGVFSSNPLFSNLVVSLDRSQLDLSNSDEIRHVVQMVKPDLIINPAAYTAVDKAETEPELAYAINATAPQVLAEEAAKLGARLIHFSTDYVYNGTKVGAYVESDETAPLGVYGKSKLAGECAIHSVGLPHFIFRTSWVYGAYGKNFLKTIIRLATERDKLRIVADQVGAPTTSTSIAWAVLNVIGKWKNETNGIYHLVNDGQTSWHGFATAIVEEYSHLQANINLPFQYSWPVLKTRSNDIEPITTKEFPTPAVRPANSCLDCSKLTQDFSLVMPNWRDALISELRSLNLH
jgi:dTDP-4-dehydrorhamnose reductase